MWRFIFLTVLLGFGTAKAQNLTVPEEILNELETVVIRTEQDTFMFRIALPDNYDKSKTYKCFIGLSGGDQTVEQVDYCYAAWFRSGYFNQYITILPVAADSINFKDYPADRIERLLSAINERFDTEPEWLIAGTSNGGIAAFNFVASSPSRFQGIITAPGMLASTIHPTAEWSHLNVILAYGQLDDKIWIKGVKAAAKQLKKSVSTLTIVPLKGQGHILPIEFNADKMYDPYFLNGH